MGLVHSSVWSGVFAGSNPATLTTLKDPIAQLYRASAFKEIMERLFWNIKKVISKGDYNYALVSGHPNSTKNGYVLEHRIVVENHLGRLLNTDEIVHHKDKNKKNNRIENLEVMKNIDHNRLHGFSKGKTYATIKCPECSDILTIEIRQTHLAKNGIYTTCSRRCNGKFSRKRQLIGLTDKMKLAISENIVRVFKRFLDNSEQTVNYRMRRDYTPTT